MVKVTFYLMKRTKPHTTIQTQHKMIRLHTNFNYSIKMLGSIGYLLFILVFSFSTNLNAQYSAEEMLGKECINCFNTQVVSIDKQDKCITIVLEVQAGTDCSSALSHYTVEVPCGVISNIKNSGGWKIENPTNDPTSGLSGFKIDDISNFGENHQSGSFTVEYTVCSDDAVCLDQVQNQIKVAYKAGTCVYYQVLVPDVESSFTAIITKSDVSCYNGNNGIARVEVEGGAEPYSYQWNTGSTMQTISGLIAGEYNVVVTDASGETLTLSALIIQPAEPITIVGTVTNSSCGNNDGSINIEVSGGTGPYTYLWNNSKTTANLLDAYAGAYTLTVMDAKGCVKRKAFQIVEDTDLKVSLTPNFLECHQEGQGEIVSLVSGGLAPYTYTWSNGATTSNISEIHSGSYSLNVVDANGCSATATTYVGIKTLSISTAVVNPTCNGGNDGEVSVIDVKYGSEPYIYTWDTGAEGAKLSDITAGRYRVTVTDANGCEVSRTINLADRQALNINYSVSARDCSIDGPAEISFNGTGGMPDYEYYLNESVVTSPLQVEGAGDYDITIKDAFGCEFTKTIVVTNGDGNISVSAEVSQPACGGELTGAANLTITGGTGPYNFLWSDGSPSQNRIGLDVGYYLVEVKDVNGCSASTDFNIDAANEVKANILGVNTSVVCQSAQNNIYGSSLGGTSFTWEVISADNSWTIISSEKDAAVFNAGTGEAKFVYSVMDDTGCLSQDSITISCTDENGGGTGDGGGSGGGSGDNSGSGDGNWEGCMNTEIAKISPINDNGCYVVEMWVYTDGTCEHELSHYDVGFSDGTINWVKNSRNWKVEMNLTDPTTGIYGFKIDDISGFGQSGPDKFMVEFEVCLNSNEFPEIIPVAYKAANGYTIQLINTYQQNTETGLEVNVFPNPFKDAVSITLLSKENTGVEVVIYDIYGSKIKTLFTGTLTADLEYTLSYDGDGTSERMLIYKVFSQQGVVQGKLLRVK